MISFSGLCAGFLSSFSALARTLRVAALCLSVLVGMAMAAEPAPPLILVVGDSISAAYGLAPERGWTSLLAQKLADERFPYRVVNASISGDTTAGGRARLPALLQQHRPAIVVIELGGNDGLRGGDLSAMRANLDAMVTAVQRAGARALLVGMRLPPNYGNRYTRDFERVFTSVADAHGAPLVPFFFEGFAERSEWFQPDRIHPTLDAQPQLLANVWPTLRTLLQKPR